MQALLQRVRHASVTVNQAVVGEIQQGLLVFLGVEPEDTPAKAEALIERILKYRVFSDAQDKMNLSLQDIQGGLLLVSQFTLAADTRKGLRPSFSSAASPALGQHLYEHALAHAHQCHPQVASGRFGADMQVSLVNDGPVTFLLSN
ncbi:D-tyrosyl-tRNA(Tyr) deacylase [Allopseudospirillum japonicum]|uniref:D-aminoacyl-tRNA deacylase n=1 Tax=Allopseudospirillum japonicum TaxID=64971 RepID=A0A1H6UH80_9GAMM|nr:D-aminoacyl-tRNA deacylase [Allopseudospirillum japonicum]SEI91679.1 D-tyrosyl-tRNA(Tyr) deacylase [Allopseudospirillum japonicum]